MTPTYEIVGDLIPGGTLQIYRHWLGARYLFVEVELPSELAGSFDTVARAIGVPLLLDREGSERLTGR